VSRLLLLLTLLAAPIAAHAEDSYAERLAELRREVELLNDELEADKEALRGRLRSLDAQRADLEAQLRREELRHEQLTRLLEEERERLAMLSTTSDELMPAVRRGLVAVRASVNSGPPFHLAERLAAIDALEAQLDAGTLPSQQAASRVWQVIEDELRLTRENAVDRQVIPLDGADVLVDVAHLGMVGLYFRTEDGRVGCAVRAADGWRWEVIGDSADTEAVLELFDALEKQIRTGWFELPAALPEVE
jgi:hypothetical protein